LLAPSGFGKTGFAKALATALGTQMHPVFASASVRPQEIYLALRQMDFGDVLFVDEAHSLERNAQQALYTAVDEYKIPALSENGRPSLATESIAEFTLVLATNQPGQITTALRNRAVPLSFSRYSIRELRAIAKQIASQSNIRLSAQAAGLIAASAQGTPRRVHLLMQVLSLLAPSATEFTLAMVRSCLNYEGIDKHGLTVLQRTYMQRLSEVPKQSCSLNHLAFRLGIDARYVTQEVECYLIETGLIEITSKNSRRLTLLGMELVKQFETAENK
jgi:Holliday junction DNA helicase RuvB